MIRIGATKLLVRLYAIFMNASRTEKTASTPGVGIGVGQEMEVVLHNRRRIGRQPIAECQIMQERAANSDLLARTKQDR